jgi:hypothetical protein
MRLTAHQTQAIRQLTQQMGRAQSRVRVNGSRLDDSARGGEVELLNANNDPGADWQYHDHVSRSCRHASHRN